MQSKVSGLLAENDSLQDLVDQEQGEKSAVQEKLLKSNAEAAQWKSKYEREALPQIEDLEDSKYVL